MEPIRRGGAGAGDTGADSGSTMLELIVSVSTTRGDERDVHGFFRSVSRKSSFSDDFPVMFTVIVLSV